jgi:tetratricopeptide (TPR) repeat protein
VPAGVVRKKSSTKYLIPIGVVAVAAVALIAPRWNRTSQESTPLPAPAASATLTAPEDTGAKPAGESESPAAAATAPPTDSVTEALPVPATSEAPDSDTYALGGRAFRESARNAFLRRGRGADREQLTVTARYHDALGDLEQAAKAYEALNRAYPQDAANHHRLGFLYSEMGRYDACVGELQEAVRINAKAAQSFILLGNCRLAMDRLQEARAAYDQALALKAEPAAVHSALYAYSLFKEDAAGAETEWGKLNDPGKARLAAISGKIIDMRRSLGQRSGRIGQPGGMNEAAAVRLFGSQALIEAVTGNEAQAQFAAQTALRVNPSAIEPAAALAIIGNSEGVKILQNLRMEFPDGTLLNSIWLPLARSAVEARSGNSATALELLVPARAYEPASASLMTIFARGRVLLQSGSGSDAAAEFQ